MPALDIAAVGHRVVHGGAKFSAPTPLTPDALSELESLNALAPLHNPPALAGTRAAHIVFGPDVSITRSILPYLPAPPWEMPGSEPAEADPRAQPIPDNEFDQRIAW